MLVKYTSDVPSKNMLASILFAVIDCRAFSLLCYRSAVVMGFASALRDFNPAIASGCLVLSASWAANAMPGCARPIAAIPAVCRKLRRANFISRTPLGLHRLSPASISSRLGVDPVLPFRQHQVGHRTFALVP